MGNVVKNKAKKFTKVGTEILKDARLSYKAKGLFSVMMSLPDNWVFSVKGLASISVDKETSINSAIKELKKYGYLIVKKLKPSESESGTFEYIYILNDEPSLQNPEVENHPMDNNQDIENLGVENLCLENLPLYKDIEDIRLDNKIDIIDIIDKNNKKKILKEKNDESLKPNELTKLLIKNGIIDNGIENIIYNRLFMGLLEEYDYELLYCVVSYVSQQLKARDFTDENGKKIENLYGYIKASVENGISYIKTLEERYED